MSKRRNNSNGTGIITMTAVMLDYGTSAPKHMHGPDMTS